MKRRLLSFAAPLLQARLATMAKRTLELDSAMVEIEDLLKEERT